MRPPLYILTGEPTARDSRSSSPGSKSLVRGRVAVLQVGHDEHRYTAKPKLTLYLHLPERIMDSFGRLLQLLLPEAESLLGRRRVRT